MPIPTQVFFRAKDGIDIGNKIDGGVTARRCTVNGTIHIHDKIDDNDTKVYYWPANRLIVDGGIQCGTVTVDHANACQGIIFMGGGWPKYPL